MNNVQESYYWISAGPQTVSVEPIPAPDRAAALADDSLESAVYAHIQALRRLGKTEANTAEIARALGLRRLDVDRVIKKLIEKDVRVIAA